VAVGMQNYKRAHVGVRETVSGLLMCGALSDEKSGPVRMQHSKVKKIYILLHILSIINVIVSC
jgi:hypothetical protein